jgi:hypothetical protein
MIILTVSLSELAPCPFCRPPNQFAPDNDENTQRDPSTKFRRNNAHAEGKHGYDHYEIIGSGIPAMRAPPALRIKDKATLSR